MEYEHPKIEPVTVLDGDVLTKDELGELKEYLAILRANHGCTTPINDLICSLVSHHVIRPLTPEDVKEKLKDLEEAFELSLQETAWICQQYPGLIADRLPAGFCLSVEPR